MEILNLQPVRNTAMVTTNPAMVIGPLLQPVRKTSAAAILNLINCK